MGNLGSISCAQDSNPPIISLAEKKPFWCRSCTAVCEVFPLRQITYKEESLNIEPSFGSSFSKSERGMFTELGSEVILNWCTGLTSSSVCRSLLSSTSLYSLIVIRALSGSKLNLGRVCKKKKVDLVIGLGIWLVWKLFSKLRL